MSNRLPGFGYALTGVVLISLLTGGCERDGGSLADFLQAMRRSATFTSNRKVTSRHALKAKSFAQVNILKENNSGPVFLAFPGQELAFKDRKNGLSLALAQGIVKRVCSAAVFGTSEQKTAWIWLKQETQKRQSKGKSEVIILGYSYGGDSAAELARRILQKPGNLRITLLVTVDAIKNDFFGFAAGTTASILSLDRPIPGYAQSLVSYTAVPHPDKLYLLRHINYYQTNSKLLRGTYLKFADENYLLTREAGGVVNHGNIDNFAQGMLVADIKSCFRKGGGK